MMSRSYRSKERDNYNQQIKDLFIKNSRESGTYFKDYLVSYGARTAMDLFLQAKQYPKGSEILMTAISSEGMIETVRGKMYPNRNELKIVPVDIEWETMGPSLHNVKSMITANTVAIVFSYPYGIVYDISKIASFCKDQKIDIIEDASEAFSGLAITGSPYADLTLFSFGMLKHTSCFGGSVAVVRHNQAIYTKMHDIENRGVKHSWSSKDDQKAYPCEPALNYFTRVGKAVRLIFLLNLQKQYFNFAKGLQLYKILNYWRKPISKLRQKISIPCLRLLVARLSEFDSVKALEDHQRLQKLRDRLDGEVCLVPGYQAEYTTDWLFPVLFDEPKKANFALWNRGIEVLAGTQVHKLVEKSEGVLEDDDMMEAERILQNITLLPVNIETSQEHIDKVEFEVVDFVIKLHRQIPIPPQRIYAKM